MAKDFSTFSMPDGPVGSSLPLPPGKPQPPPDYARGHANNQRGVAPDKHNMTGPYIGTKPDSKEGDGARMAKIASVAGDGYWLSEYGALGKSPFAPAGYQFYRNVKDFGAKGDGVTDDTAAINRAASAFSQADQNVGRCGEECGSTTTLTALVYFPPGTYRISKPIIQYYYTQFVGNPDSRPIIKGSKDFEGIALFDNNYYIPNGNGDQWYVNQSNFFRQIRNFVFDMTGMNRTNYQHDQKYVPAGIHWQVGQATSITNCHFEMALSDASGPATGIGIFMENGSGGTVSDLTFRGGNIGFLAGSQQFTATNLRFTSCLTAIKHEWNWGFVWKNIYVLSCYVAIDCTAFSESTNPPQGTASITVLDSHFNGVPYAITLGQKADQQPSIVLDNLLVENSASVVLVSGGDTLLAGSSSPRYFDFWISGYQVLPDGQEGKQFGFASVKPKKPQSLLDGSGGYLHRPKPQYPAMTPIIATQHGVSNDGTGDQTSAINRLLSSNVGSVVFFPAGIYLVRGTIEIPSGSRIIGSGWSTIMGEGPFFSDEFNPKVMVRVGKAGQSGLIEITDMLFTVKGNTAGCILMEWNIRESSPGSAAMWDSHFRVGGNAGSDLLLDDCPANSGSVKRECMAASMLLHLPKGSSGYFDNVWVWVADHDLDDPANAQTSVGPGGIPENSAVEISIYAGRGVLVESEGPVWFWGCGSEHAQLYQWQLMNAKDVFMGHVQTETPYFQSDPTALEPYKIGVWEGDPTFDDCSDDLCRKAWALRIINSTDIFTYGLGFYSFFEKYSLGCAPNQDCQQRLIETNYSERIWLFNIFTVGNIEIVSPRGRLDPVWYYTGTKNGYTSSVAAWLALALNGGDIGSGATSGGEVVFLDPAVYSGTPAQCNAPCQFVLPARPLRSMTTISIPPYTTSLELAPGTTTTITVDVPEIVTESLEYYNVNITSGQNGGHRITPTVSLSIWPITTAITLPGGEVQVRTLQLPPWPAITGIPPPGPEPSNSNPAETDIMTSLPPPVLPPRVTFTTTSKPEFTPPGDNDETPSATWPESFEIQPVETEVAENGEDDDGDGPRFKASCKLWFFTLCISWPEFDISFFGWEWDMPPGVWGPGPPPIHLIKLPPGMTIKGTLPPWPKITVLGQQGMTTGWREIRAYALGFTPYFYVKSLGPLAKAYFNSDIVREVRAAYVPNAYQPPPFDGVQGQQQGMFQSNTRSPEASKNITESELLQKRALMLTSTDKWYLSMVSMPSGYEFDEIFEFEDTRFNPHLPFNNPPSYSHAYESSNGAGERVYVVGGDWRGPRENAYSNARPRELRPPAWGSTIVPTDRNRDHGYLTAAYAVSRDFGVAPNANLVFVEARNSQTMTFEKMIESLTLIADDSPGEARSVVAIPSGTDPRGANAVLLTVLCALMERMESEQGISFVVSSRYTWSAPDVYPQKCSSQLRGMIIVGHTDRDGQESPNIAGEPDVWAPGVDLPVPRPNDGVISYTSATGSSFAGPLVAGLVAYLRGHPRYPQYMMPSQVKALVRHLARNVQFSQAGNGSPRPETVWNGEGRPPKYDESDCSDLSKRGLHVRQSCELPGGNGPPARGPPVTYRPGEPGPLCMRDCGRLCSGYYCSPSPSGTPPDFAFPRPTPDSGGNNGGDNGGGDGGFGHLPGLPTLPPNPGQTAPPGEVCLSSATVTECNGNPRNPVCQTTTSCASFGTRPPSHLPNLPTLGPVPSPPGGKCIKSETWTLIGGPRGEATATTSGCASWEVPGPTAQPPPPPPPPPKPRCIAAHVFMSNCPFQSDVVTIQIWENGRLICSDSEGAALASDLTEFNFDCGAGGRAKVTGNARRLEYTAADGWKPQMKNYGFDFDNELLLGQIYPITISESSLAIRVSPAQLKIQGSDDQIAVFWHASDWFDCLVVIRTPHDAYFGSVSSTVSSISSSRLYTVNQERKNKFNQQSTIIMNSLKNAGHAISEKAQEIAHGSSHHANKQIAKDPNAPIGTRLSAAKNSISDKHRATGWPMPRITNREEFFKSACPREEVRSKRLIQSSISSQGLEGSHITPSNNGFVWSAVHAYSNHHHLTIRPDEVWFVIITQISFYINANAGKLRSLFVSHKGQEHLQIQTTGSINTVDFGLLAERMTHLISQNVKDPQLRAWIMPSFSTTTTSDRVVASILFMGAMQKYFSYEIMITCGIPTITLLGEKADWEIIQSRLDMLEKLGDEAVQFAAMLRPILRNMILSFVQPTSAEVTTFWNQMITEDFRGSGRAYISGWLGAFCFWTDEGIPKYSVESAFSNGIYFPKLYLDDLPDGFASVPVTINDDGTIYACTMVAGSIGIEASCPRENLQEWVYKEEEEKEEEEEAKDIMSEILPLIGKTDTPLTMIQPISGWFMFENRDEDVASKRQYCFCLPS
ncbi:Glucan 1,3-beta-glucosidase [Paramyrothecium foliicola]|nr:Glucan 1,3-beta-glucosidase [Paramyrothecium foliicola]